MTKLAVFSGIEVVNILEKNGFVKIRQKGSHISMQKISNEIEDNTVIPLHSEIAKGTLSSIIRQSGLNRELFCK